MYIYISRVSNQLCFQYYSKLSIDSKPIYGPIFSMANRLGPQMLQLVIHIVSELEGIRLDLKNDRPWGENFTL